MGQYVLDTDHVSLLLAGHISVRSKVDQLVSETMISIVTVQEVFNGWIVRINDPKQANRLVNLYTKLRLVVDFLQNIDVLNFDAAAEAQYQHLLQTAPISVSRESKKM